MADISVIIPCYNVEKYIDRCLQTITGQTIGVEKLEIICVDDASMDGTVSKLLEWEQKYPEQIMVVCCEENGGLGRARNIGTEYSTSEWIAYIDSDDWIELDYFQRLYEVAVLHDCDVVTCEYRRDVEGAKLYFEERSSGKGERQVFVQTEADRVELLANKTAGIGVPTKMVRKSILVDNEICFPEGVAYEDCFWGMLLHFYIQKIVMLDEVLYHYRINETSLSLKKGAYHHIDYMIVMKRLWKECERRGFLTTYREELELEVLATFYCDFLKMLSVKFEKPPYSYFLMAQELIPECVPDFRTNYYVRQGCFSRMIMNYIEALQTVHSRTGFEKLIEQVRNENIL